MLRVTDEEFTAITAARKVHDLIVSDSQYLAWFTDSHRHVIDAGASALSAALARHNFWHDTWLNASESERPAVEAACAAAESKMKTVKF